MSKPAPFASCFLCFSVTLDLFRSLVLRTECWLLWYLLNSIWSFKGVEHFRCSDQRTKYCIFSYFLKSKWSLKGVEHFSCTCPTCFLLLLCFSVPWGHWHRQQSIQLSDNQNLIPIIRHRHTPSCPSVVSSISFQPRINLRRRFPRRTKLELYLPKLKTETDVS